ncbi:MAG: IS66 family transposase [Candidatus Hadarchaeales archaeon]
MLDLKGIERRTAGDPELRESIRELLQENQKLREEIKKLVRENRELRRRLERFLGPVKDCDFKIIRIRRVGSSSPKKRRPYHPGTSRRKPREVDEVVTTRAGRCPVGHRLGRPMYFEVRTVEDIVPASVVRKKYMVAVYWCRKCKRKFRANPLDAFPRERFGINLMLFVAFLRIQGFTFPKIGTLLREIYGLHLSTATLIRMERRVAEEFSEEYERIRREVLRSPVVHTDETGWPVKGLNRWLWVFISGKAALYAVKRSRGRRVVEEVLGDYKGTVVNDFYPSFDRLPYRSQKCLLHLLRNPERVEHRKGRPTQEFVRFHSRLRRLVRDAVRASELRGEERKAAKRRLERRLSATCSRYYRDGDCRRICRLLRKHGARLFTFLELEGLPWNNNEAERALRPSVVVRKNSYGSRSETGAWAHSILMSVSQTCRKQGSNFLDFGRAYLASRAGSYSLPKR